MPLMIRPVCLLYALLAPAPLLACATGEDLASGVVLVTEARNMMGEFNEHQVYLRAAEPGVLATTFHSQLTDDTWQSLDLGGVLALHVMRTSGEMEATGEFAPEVAALFPPGPAEVHQFEGTWTSARGTWTSVYTMETGAEVTAQIGDCRYAAVEFSLTDERTRPDGTVSRSTEAGLYIPELMLLRAPDNGRSRAIDLRRPTLIERFYWPFRGL